MKPIMILQISVEKIDKEEISADDQVYYCTPCIVKVILQTGINRQ